MAIYETNTAAPFGAVTTLGIVNFFDNAIAQFSAWNAARKTTAALSGLSDRQLEDIGLHRGAISAVASNIALNRF